MMILNHQGIQKYNTDVKICGNNISLKLYENYQIKGYKVSSSLSDGAFSLSLDDLKGVVGGYYSELEKIKARLKIEELEYIKKERWNRTNLRAKQKIVDLVACNTGKWSDYKGFIQTTKFLTLTFKENTEDTKNLEWANNEVSKYLKRISYNVFGVNKNVFKYICVPELQERGVWHFHMVIFNMPYIKHFKLLKWWGGKNKGSVNIKAIKEKSEGLVARYVVKYMTSGIGKEDKHKEKNKKAEYERYLDLGMENTRRYNPSRGLHQPIKLSYKADKKDMEEVVKILAIGGYLEQLSEQKTNVIDYNVIKSEERGEITYINFTIKDRDVLNYFKNKQMEKTYNSIVMWKEKMDFKKNKNIIEKIRYSLRYKKSRIKNIDKFNSGKETIKPLKHERKQKVLFGVDYVKEDIYSKVI